MVQVWLVAGDCFLIGLAPVLVHMSKGPDGKFPFHPVSINLLVEVAKTLFATIILMIYVSLHSCLQISDHLFEWLVDALLPYSSWHAPWFGTWTEGCLRFRGFLRIAYRDRLIPKQDARVFPVQHLEKKSFRGFTGQANAIAAAWSHVPP